MAKLKEEGRNFVCNGCPTQVQKLRRCREPREDFGPKDAPFWPIQLHPGGQRYGFCPAKATWDHEVVSLYNALVVIAETGQLPEAGGLNAQPDWLIDHLAWFLPNYQLHRFANQARMLFGDSKK